MPRQCAVCAHAQRSEIDADIVSGQHHRTIARRWGVSDDSIDRHVKAAHSQIIKRPSPAAMAVVQQYTGDDLINKLQELIGVARGIMSRALEANQHGAAMAGIRELVRIHELMARLTGQLDEGTRINVLIEQQQQAAAAQELMLDRLTVAERLELRRLVAKAQGELDEPGRAVSAQPAIGSAGAADGGS